jgi:hypothetical protein
MLIQRQASSSNVITGTENTSHGILELKLQREYRLLRLL